MKTRGRGRNFVKVGTVKVFHYRSADGRTFIDARRYGRPLLSRKDHDEAMAEARRLAIEINGGGLEAMAFTAKDRAVYARASEIAADAGADLLEAVRVGVASMRRPVHKTSEVVAELLAAKRIPVKAAPRAKAVHDLDGRYARDIRHQLRDFAAAFPGDLAAIGPGDIEAWLDARLRKDGGPLSAKRRNHVHGTVAMLFRFARSRGYLPDVVTAVGKIEKRKVARGKVGIFSAVEMQAILSHVETKWLPYIAIAGFSGVRSEEIALSYHAAARKDSLRWEDIDWTAKEICVRAEVAKTGHPRRCPMSENLVAWLAPWKKSTGRVVSGSLQKAMKRFKAKLSETPGVPPALLAKWPHNVLRHSYGSYEMARTGNLQQLAYWMGDSPSMIQRHYHNPRPRSEADAWFSLFPETAINVVQLTAAAK